MTISPGVPMTADSTDRRDELARAVADIIRAEVREALAMPDGEFWPSFAADKAAVAVIDHLHAAGRMYAPPLIDREDRDELIEVMRWAIEGETSWTGSVALYPIIADAIIATGWLRATGPARDEGLRALSDAATPGPWFEPYFEDGEDGDPGDAGWWIHAGVGTGEHAVGVTVPYNPQAEADALFIAAAVNHVRAALADEPAPGGDEGAADRAAVDASRADGGPNVSLDDLKAELDLPATCTCTSGPDYDGPEADCDVHGLPLAAYAQGFADGAEGSQYARPAPGGDTAPREDGLREALEEIRLVAGVHYLGDAFDREHWRELSNIAADALSPIGPVAPREDGVLLPREDGTDDLWLLANDALRPFIRDSRTRHAAVDAIATLIAARPVPLGPAATRDGEAGG